MCRPMHDVFRIVNGIILQFQETVISGIDCFYQEISLYIS